MAGTLQSISVGTGNTFSLRRPTYVDNIALTTTPYVWVPPSTGVAHVLMSCSGNFAALYTATTVNSSLVALPTTVPTTDGSAGELNPTMREIKGVGAIGLVAGTTTNGLTLLTIASFLP